jgi:hypothetical protein
LNDQSQSGPAQGHVDQWLAQRSINSTTSTRKPVHQPPSAPTSKAGACPTCPTACRVASLTNSQPHVHAPDQSIHQTPWPPGSGNPIKSTAADTNATNFPLRVTLVWTDPPGDPAAGIALVNNLDLWSPRSSGTNAQDLAGQRFLQRGHFHEVNTGDLPDVINNVQNVYIDSTNAPFQFP